MGCASSVNVQIEDSKDNRKIISDGKEIGTIKKDNNDRIEEREEENQDEDYLEMPTVKKSKNENTQSKTIANINNIPNIHNIKINDNFYNNQSMNYKYLKDNKMDLIKSNPIINGNTNQDNNNDKFIPLKHPLDISLDNNVSQLKNIYISQEKQVENNQNNNNVDLMNSIEERINNYNGNNNRGDDEEDGVNMGNYDNGDNDDMCNLGQSMNFDKMKNNKDNQDGSNEICVIFEIQSTGIKYIINVNKNVKLIDLIELFKKKIQLSPFEKPEFVFDSVFLIDFEKSISDYNIKDNSKINVFI